MEKNKNSIPPPLLKMVEFSFSNRSQMVYIRFPSFGKDTKVSLNIRIPKGYDIDMQTGIVNGQAEITKQILT